MKQTQTMLGAALLAGASATASPALAGYHWDPACGCQRTIAYVAPQPYVAEPVVVFRPRVVYRPQVVYEPVPAYVVRVPVVHGCCAGRGIYGYGPTD